MKLNIWHVAWLLVGAFGAWALREIYETNHGDDEQVVLSLGPSDDRWVSAMFSLCRDGHRPVITFLSSADPTRPNDFKDRKADCSPGRDWRHYIRFGNCPDGRRPRIYRGNDAVHDNYAADCSPNRTPGLTLQQGESET